MTRWRGIVGAPGHRPEDGRPTPTHPATSEPEMTRLFLRLGLILGSIAAALGATAFAAFRSFDRLVAEARRPRDGDRRDAGRPAGARPALPPPRRRGGTADGRDRAHPPGGTDAPER